MTVSWHKSSKDQPANGDVQMYEYGDYNFQTCACFGGFSCTIWYGTLQDQIKELGLWATEQECIEACVKWIDKREAARANGRL